eukprot:1473645-Prymnesium_polylepis.1
MVSEHAAIWKERLEAAEAALMKARDREQSALCALAHSNATSAAIHLAALTTEARAERLMVRLQSSESKCDRVTSQLQVSLAARSKQTQCIELLREKLLDWTKQPA